VRYGPGLRARTPSCSIRINGSVRSLIARRISLPILQAWSKLLPFNQNISKPMAGTG